MNEIESFGAYRAALAAVRPEDYAGALAASAHATGSTADEARAQFEGRLAAVLRETEGIEPLGSYRDANGRVFDCVPWEQVPSVRDAHRAGRSVARHAPAPLRIGPKGEPGAAGWVPDRTCPDGAVALPRYSPEDLIRFMSLPHGHG